jgi:hypothetical protein
MAPHRGREDARLIIRIERIEAKPVVRRDDKRGLRLGGTLLEWQVRAFT